ncbi:hypothetical protein FBQ85_13560 [Cytophagia bacterium CHB2]|nr:hypothetical protein [Cytophagia bacterium CHB2]
MRTLVLILLSGLAMTACQKDSDFTLDPNATSGAALQATKTSNLEGDLQEIAQYLAQNEGALAARFNGDMKRAPAALADLRLQKHFPARLDSDGRIYEVEVEACRGSSSANSQALRVALDPDRFYGDEPAFPAYVFDREQKTVKVENIVKAEAKQKGLPFPLALVSVQDRTESAWPKVIKDSRVFKELERAAAAARANGGNPASHGGQAQHYLAVTKVRVHDDRDDFGFEEFEIFIREGNGPEDHVQPVTTHLFNGGRRRDAAGRLVFYADVNLIDTTYVLESPIALWPLSDSMPIAIVPMEDDCAAGEHRNSAFPGIQHITMQEEYDRPSQSMRNNVGYSFLLTGRGCGFWGTNDDDIYKRGPFRGWTVGNTPAEEISINLGDVQLWVKRLTVQAPVGRQLLSAE